MALGRLLTPTEVAAMLRVPLGTVYQWRSTGRGPRASRCGKHLRYRESDVEKWLDEHAAKQGDAQ
jgi:excisionase family DNA binding protein